MDQFTISSLLEDLKLKQYTQCFRDNDIDETVIFELTDEQLEKIGISSVGHRATILRCLRESQRLSSEVNQDAPAANILLHSINGIWHCTLGALLLYLFLYLPFNYHIIFDALDLIPKKHTTLERTFVFLGDVVNEYNKNRVVHALGVGNDELFDNLVRQMAERGYLVTGDPADMPNARSGLQRLLGNVEKYVKGFIEADSSAELHNTVNQIKALPSEIDSIALEQQVKNAVKAIEGYEYVEKFEVVSLRQAPLKKEHILVTSGCERGRCSLYVFKKSNNGSLSSLIFDEGEPSSHIGWDLRALDSFSNGMRDIHIGESALVWNGKSYVMLQ